MQADEQPESKAEYTIDLKVAEALERWEKAIANGNTPDPLQIAEGDSDLARQIVDLTGVLRKLDQSGFSDIDRSKLAELVGDDAIANEIAIPDFEWLSELGRGGMGVVYEARQLSLNRIVALKLLPLGTLDPQAARRFEREATTASSLQHPHIVPIYAAGQAAGTHWYAMQKIDGQSLAEMIHCNPKGIDWKRTLEIGIQVTEALVYAHQQGVVHRDIKPGNLLEDRTGHIWLTDFGLARNDADATATLSHAMMGTPRYMSPEQIDANRKTDHRTDLYGLGATLYELATGAPLYSGNFPLDVIQKIRVDDPERPSKINPRIPRALEVVIQKCLEKSPRDRYATAADLLSDLKSIQAGRPIQASGLSIWTRWHRKWIRHGSRIRLAATAALISIVMAAVGVILYQSYRAGRMSSLKISSVGGPYMARIHSFDANKEPSPMLPQIMRAALPIDQGLALESGQYEVSFSSRGRFSERAVVQLPAGSGIDAQYVDRRPSPVTIDVEGKWLEVIEAEDGSRKTFLAILDDENLVIYDQSREKFTWKLSDIAGEIEPDRPLSMLPIGRGLESSLHGNRHARNPFFAKVHPLKQTAVDLDGDRLLDFVVSARTEPVVAAVSSDGKRLWTARADVALPDNPTAPYQAPDKSLIPYPSVRQLLSVVDYNEDGTSDVLINTIAIRNGATYAQLTLLSGRDGTHIWTEPLPVMTPTNGTRWPLDGLLNNFAWITKRQSQPLVQSSNGLPITNITVSPQFDVQWGSFMQARVPVTPPIAIVNIQDKQFAAIAIDNSTVRCLDMKTGKWSVDSMTDTKPFCLGPRRVRLGKGESDGLLALRLVTPTAQGSGGLEQLSVSSIKDSKILWSNDLNLRLEYIANKQEQSDFPLIVTSITMASMRSSWLIQLRIWPPSNRSTAWMPNQEIADGDDRIRSRAWKSFRNVCV